MKKFLIAALLIVGMTSFAQDRPADDKAERMEKFTPEQRVQLHLKKLTLDLGLNDSQQKQMEKLLSEQAKKREVAAAEYKAQKTKGVKPTADQRFAQKSKMLDEQIGYKEQVKKILTADQFQRYENLNEKKRDGMKKHHAGKEGLRKENNK